MQRLFLIVWVLCTFKTVFLKPRSTHCNFKYWLLTTSLTFKVFLWYTTELMQFVFSLCSSLKVSSFNELVGSLELWHTSCPQSSLQTVWKGSAVAAIPSGPWWHRLRAAWEQAMKRQCTHTLQGCTIHGEWFNAFVTCYVWRGHSGSKGTVW